MADPVYWSIAIKTWLRNSNRIWDEIPKKQFRKTSLRDKKNLFGQKILTTIEDIGIWKRLKHQVKWTTGNVQKATIIILGVWTFEPNHVNVQHQNLWHCLFEEVKPLTTQDHQSTITEIKMFDCLISIFRMLFNFGSLWILVGNVKTFDHLISNIAIFLNRQQKYEKEPDFWLTTKIIKLQDYETEFRRTVWKRKEYLIKVEVSWEGHRNLKKIFT